MHRVVRAQGIRGVPLDTSTPRNAHANSGMNHPALARGRDVGALAVGAGTLCGGAGRAVQAGAAGSIDRIATHSATTAAATLHAVRADSTDTPSLRRLL